ncbi:MAG: NAD(+) diphosphatase [Lachnospiraceae bacterium]|nr:NAD(+) diphosphatase [Lachnospiraceae bacterium]
MLHEIAPYQYHIEFKTEDPAPDDFLCLFQDGKILARETEELSLPTAAEMEPYLTGLSLDAPLFTTAPGGRYTFFCSIDTRNFFGIPGVSVNAPEGFYYRPTRELRMVTPQHIVYGAMMATQLNLWYVTHAYCGKCGKRNGHSGKERALVCPDCGNVIYPQISPSVIIGIKNGNKLLCTQYNPMHNPGARMPHPAKRSYALVAGYIESGETPEDAVRRETMEEVGIRVKNLRYYKSQPWPFSSSLLLGYTCEVDGDDTITLEEDELSLAEWVEREDLPDRSRDISLTSEIMETFRTGKW